MPNILTCGFTHEEALAMAKEALDLCLETDIARKIRTVLPGVSET